MNKESFHLTRLDRKMFMRLQTSTKVKKHAWTQPNKAQVGYCISITVSLTSSTESTSVSK